jgi:hypothetical protein
VQYSASLLTNATVCFGNYLTTPTVSRLLVAHLRWMDCTYSLLLPLLSEPTDSPHAHSSDHSQPK